MHTNPLCYHAYTRAVKRLCPILTQYWHILPVFLLWRLIDHLYGVSCPTNGLMRRLQVCCMLCVRGRKSSLDEHYIGGFEARRPVVHAPGHRVFNSSPPKCDLDLGLPRRRKSGLCEPFPSPHGGLQGSPYGSVVKACIPAESHPLLLPAAFFASA